jgi:hypothetical protein
MTRPEQTWQEKRLAKEEGGSSSDKSGGEDNPGSGDRNPESGNCNPKSGNCHPESGNRNPDLGNSNLGKENDRQGEEPVSMDINMVFTISAEFCAPVEDVAELALATERAIEAPPSPAVTPPSHVCCILLID